MASGTGTATRMVGRVLFGAVAFGTTAIVASFTVVPLVGEDLSGSKALSGVPWAIGVFGTGVGSVLVAQVMARRGRGPGLIAGYVVGGLGSVLCVVAMTRDSFVLFVVAAFVLGTANSSNQLARYAAADVSPPDRRAAAVGTVVWAGTIGGVAGPALLAPVGRIAAGAGLPRLSGGFIAAAAGCVGAIVVLGALLARLPDALRSHEPDDLVSSGISIVQMWRVPRARVALLSLAVAQTVMVMIMAMTPVHIRSTGHNLDAIGWVIGAHVFGMYGLSPVCGRLSDRFGAVRMVLAGFGVLALASLMAASAPHDAGVWLAVPLFLLGFGWSLTFVSASALLAHGLSYTDRARLQGATDAVVWTAAATAGLASGFLVGTFGYGLLCAVGAMLLAVPAVAVTGRRRALAASG